MTSFTFNKLIATVIAINAVAITLNEFPSIREATNGVLHWVDFACVIFFIFEASLKIKTQGFKPYISKGWNKFDFVVTVASIPVLIEPFLSQDPGTSSIFTFASVLRISRIFRSARLLRFIPNSDHLAAGIGRSLKASLGILIALVMLNLSLALAATMLFGQLSPEHFGNPIKSSYSLLKIFTVEGWYEIPEEVNDNGGDPNLIHFLHGFAIFAVLAGGIFGLSLANAVFVDEMTADNTQKVENMVANLHEEIRQLREDLKNNPPTQPNNPS